MKSENLKLASKFPVKLEIVEDSLEEEHAPLNKRSKVRFVKFFILKVKVCIFINGFVKKKISYGEMEQTSLG